jgi:hypothetical protein
MSEILSASKAKEEVLKAETEKRSTFSDARITSAILADLRSDLQQLNAMRQATLHTAPVNISLAEYVKEKYGFAPNNQGIPESFYLQLGIDPNQTTVKMIQSLPDTDGKRWLVPEIFRDAIRSGIRTSPIYKDLIAAEENVKATSVILPYINATGNKVAKVGEVETIPVGTISYADKTVKLSKVATGIKISYEVLAFCSINQLQIYLEDTGVRLGTALDKMCVDAIINGDQADGSESIPVVGTTSGSAVSYDNDLLQAWITMSMLGKSPKGMILGKTMAAAMLALPEFKNRYLGTPLVNLNMKTPLPSELNIWVHGGVPSNYAVLIDTLRAAVKHNAMSMMVEEKRDPETQQIGQFVSMITGFSTLTRDSRLAIQRDATLVAKPYSAYSFLDFETYQNSVLIN